MIKSLLKLIALATMVAGLFAGCSAFGTTPEKVTVIEVGTPLKEPAWVSGKKTLLALAEDEPKVVKLDPDTGETTSRWLEDVGETVTPNPGEPDLAYLPQPDLGRVAVLDTDTLRATGKLVSEVPPWYTTLDVQSEILFALSEDGSTVVGWDLESLQDVPRTRVGGGEETLVEAPEKGLDPAFWVAGPDGVAYYGGDPPERLVSLPIEVGDIAVDLTSAQRAYVSESGTGRVVAVEGDPEGLVEGELLVKAERRLEEEVLHLASGELYVFAATRGSLVILRREGLEVIETVEFSEYTDREALAGAVPSGITVGKKDVYITLGGEPYVLSIRKP